MTTEKNAPENELEERAKAYRNSPNGQFTAAMDIAMENIDRKIEPLLKRLDDLEERITQRQTGADRPKGPLMTWDKFKLMSMEEKKKLRCWWKDEVNILAGKVFELEEEIAKALVGMRADIDGLKTRGLEYKGVYQRALTYQRGDVVTLNGDAWVAVVDIAKGKPGDSQDFQLFVKAR